MRAYLWRPRLLEKSVGHIALALSDGTYISFWPPSPTLLKKSGRSQSYEEDVRVEGRPADDELLLPDDLVNQHAIRTWWKRYSVAYNLVTNNCADVVLQALKVGNIRELQVEVRSCFCHLWVFLDVTAWLFRSNLRSREHPANTPISVFEWLRLYVKEIYSANCDIQIICV